MSWKESLKKLQSEHPRSLKLVDGASRSEIDELEKALGCSIKDLDSSWREFLEFSNGMQILGYSFYAASGQSIRTISFKTLFLWEVNRIWQNRMFLFMGVGGVLEIGILRPYLGASCVAVIRGTGYEIDEAIPIASDFDTFLDTFIEEAQEAVQREASRTTLPSLDTWPPKLDRWYAHDASLVRRLRAAGLKGISKENKQYAEYIFKSCQAVTDRP